MEAHKDNQKDKLKNVNKQIWWEVIAVLSVVHTIAALSLMYYTPSTATVKLTAWLVVLGAFGYSNINKELLWGTIVCGPTTLTKLYCLSGQLWLLWVL